MSVWILPGKIGRPTPPEGFLERDLLQGAALPPVSLLMGGPGYGKTLGLVALSKRAEAAGYTTAWLTLDEMDTDPVSVFHHLIAGVRVQVPPFGQETETLLGAGHIEPTRVWHTFLRELSAFNAQPGVLICVDDLQFLDAHLPDMGKAFYYYLDKLPTGVHLALASRSRPKFALEKMAGRGFVRVFGPEELRFSAAEAIQLWMAQGRPEPPPLWIEAIKGYEGWPLGLAFAAARPQRAGTGPLVANASTVSPARYVAEEFYGAQSPELQKFMVEAAALHAVTVDACVKVCEIQDAGRLLEQLENTLLVQRLVDGSYRFPAYLRDFLLAQGAATRTQAARASLHARAGRYYLESGQPEAAYPHLVDAADWSTAVETLRQLFPTLYARGRQSQLQRYISALAKDVQDGPWPQFWWGQLAWRDGESGRAGAHYERAIVGFKGDGDREGETKAAMRLYTLAVTRQDAATAVYDSAVRALVEHGRDEDRADLFLLEALQADHRGDLDSWQASNEAVLALPLGANIEVAQCACIARMNLYTLALHRGDLTRAKFHSSEAQAIAGTWDFKPEELFAGFLLAHVQIISDELEPAGTFLKSLNSTWEEVLDWHSRACALTTIGTYHLARGEWKEAEEALGKASAHFDKAGFPLGKKLPLERQIWLAIQRDRPQAALALLDQAGDLTRTNVYDLAIRLGGARAQDLAGSTAEALKGLAEIEKDAIAMRAPLAVARARLYAAAAHLRSGNQVAAKSNYDAAIELIEQESYEFLRRQDAALWKELGAIATPATLPGSANSSSAGRLEIRLFGGLEARLDGILLDQWPRRKSKVLLAALAMTPRGLPASTLAELIDDRTPRQAGVQMCITALRRQFEPDLKDGSKSRFVVLQDERYILEPSNIGYCDVRSFSSEVQAGLRVRTDDPSAAKANLEKALEHYRGNLLDEPFFEPLFEAEREGYRRLALEALGWLHERNIFLGDDQGGLQHLERATVLAPCDEEVAIRAMKYHALRRAPERLRAVYWDHRKSLNRILSLTPSPDFESAYREALKLAGA